jgi:hypothetical protein
VVDCFQKLGDLGHGGGGFRFQVSSSRFPVSNATFEVQGLRLEA